MKTSVVTAMISLASISCAGQAGQTGISRDGGADGGAVIPCSSDLQCESSSGCFAKRCVERLGSVDNWAVELTPPPVSDPTRPVGTYGPLVTVQGVGEPPVVLTVSPELDLVVQFQSDSTSPTTIPLAASVVLTVPSGIPGRPDLSFQATLTSTKASATLKVSDGVLGQRATVNLIPLPPSDVSTPPYTFLDVPIPMSGPLDVTQTVPAASFKLSGQLVDSFDQAKANFTARAFQRNLLASTTAVTSTVSGGFTIYLPAGSGPVDLELLPPSGAVDPWLTLMQIPLTPAPKDLGPIALPAYLSANTALVTVHGDTLDETPVPGATVRALASVVGGETRAQFLRDGSTDANGTAQLFLIPGDSQTAVPYTLSVVPPPGSPWASRCVEGVPVLWNGSGTATMQNFTLEPRLVVSGTLLSVDGAPVANAIVTATRKPPVASGCLPGPATTSVSTDASGAFALWLDKGDYQLDYDPPSGSAAPRMTEYDVNVGADLPQTVRLPRPRLYEGDVEDAQGEPVPSATIRIFQLRCPTPDSCLAPTLIGQTQSDAAGHFRTIVAAP